MANRFKVVGVNDDQSFCECCGKSGLQRVVWIEDTETGDVKHFGTTCANSPVKGFDLKDEIKSAVRRYDDHQKSIGLAAFKRYRKLYDGPTEPITGPYGFKGAEVVIGARATDQALYARCRVEVAAAFQAGKPAL